MVLKALQYVFSLITLFSIEFDLWSSIKKDAVLSIVAYFLANGKRHKLVLDTLPMVDGTSHDAESYSKTIKDCLKRYDLEAPSRVVAATTDGVKVNFATGRILNTDIQKCAAHLLALLVKDICEIGQLFDALEQCIALKNMFSRSTINNEWLRIFKAECELNCGNIQGFSVTRWNFVFQIFNSIYQNLVALKSFVTRFGPAMEECVVDSIDFEFLERVLPTCIIITKLIDHNIHKLYYTNAYLGDVYHNMKSLKIQLLAEIEDISMNEDLSIIG